MTDETPLIYTSKGNLPIDGLELKVKWDFDPQGITFAEEYYQGEELVRRSAHRFQYPPEATTTQQGDFNG